MNPKINKKHIRQINQYLTDNLSYNEHIKEKE